MNRRRGLASGMAAVILLPLLSACVLTQDRLDPALEVPRAYRAAHGPPNAAPPPLDWWQTFRSAELTDLMQQANAANFSIAAAVARIVEADAQARIAGAALLPMLNATANVQKSQISTAVGGAVSQRPAAVGSRRRIPPHSMPAIRLTFGDTTEH